MVFLGQLVKSLVGRCCLLSVYFNKYWPGRLSAGEELPFHLGFMSSDLSWCNPSWAGTVQWILPQIHAESVFIEKWCFGADWEFALWKWRNIQRESSGFFQQSDISLNLLVAELKAVSHRFSLLVENSVMKLNCLRKLSSRGISLYVVWIGVQNSSWVSTSSQQACISL